MNTPQKRFIPQQQQQQKQGLPRTRNSLQEISSFTSNNNRSATLKTNNKLEDVNKFRINLNENDSGHEVEAVQKQNDEQVRKESPVEQPIWKSFSYDPNTSIYLIKKEKILDKFLVDKQYLRIAELTKCTINLHENTNDNTSATIYFKVIGSYEARCSALELLRNETDRRGVIVNLPLNLSDTNKKEPELKDTRRYSSNKNLTRMNSINQLVNYQAQTDDTFRSNSVMYRKPSTSSSITNTSHTMKRTKSYQNKFDLTNSDYNNNNFSSYHHASHNSNLFDYEFDLSGNRTSLEDRYLLNDSTNQQTSFNQNNHKASSIRISTFNKQQQQQQQQQQEPYIQANRPESYHQAQQNGFYMSKNNSFSNYSLNSTQVANGNSNKNRKTLSFSSSKPDNNFEWNQQMMDANGKSLHISANTSQLTKKNVTAPASGTSTTTASNKKAKSQPPKRYTFEFLLERADSDESKKQPSDWPELNLKFPNVCFSGRVISYFNPSRYEAYWIKTKELNQELHSI